MPEQMNTQLLEEISKNLQDLNIDEGTPPKTLQGDINKELQDKAYESQIDYSEKWKDVDNLKKELTEPIQSIDDTLKKLYDDISKISMSKKQVSVAQTPQMDLGDLADAQESRDKENRQPLIDIGTKLDVLNAYFLGGSFIDALKNIKQKPMKVELDGEGGGGGLLGGGGKGFSGFLQSLGMAFRFWGKNAVEILKGVTTFVLAMGILTVGVLGIMKLIELVDINVNEAFLKKFVAFVGTLVVVGGMLAILTNVTKGISVGQLIKSLLTIIIAIPFLGAAGLGVLNMLDKFGKPVPMNVLLSFAAGLIIVAGVTFLFTRILGGTSPAMVLKAGLALVGMSIALIPFVFVLRLLSGVKIDLNQFGSMALIIVGLGALMIALSFAATYMIGGILALIGIGTGMLLLSTALKTISTMQIPSKEKIASIVDIVQQITKAMGKIKFDKNSVKGFKEFSESLKIITSVGDNLLTTSKGIDQLSIAMDKFGNVFGKIQNFKFKDVLKGMAEGIKELTKASNDLKKLSGKEGIQVLSEGFKSFSEIKMDKLVDLFAGDAMTNLIEFAKYGKELGGAGKGVLEFSRKISQASNEGLAKLDMGNLKKLTDSISAVKLGTEGTSSTGSIGTYLETIIDILYNKGIVVRAMPNSGGNMNMAMSVPEGQQKSVSELVSAQRS